MCRVVCTRVGKNASDDFIEIQAETKIEDAVKHLGVYVEFVGTKRVDSESEKSNANETSSSFTLMMNAANNRSVLPSLFEPTDNK